MDVSRAQEQRSKELQNHVVQFHAIPDHVRQLLHHLPLATNFWRRREEERVQVEVVEQNVLLLPNVLGQERGDFVAEQRLVVTPNLTLHFSVCVRIEFYGRGPEKGIRLDGDNGRDRSGPHLPKSLRRTRRYLSSICGVLRRMAITMGRSALTLTTGKLSRSSLLKMTCERKTGQGMLKE